MSKPSPRLSAFTLHELECIAAALNHMLAYRRTSESEMPVYDAALRRVKIAIKLREPREMP